MTPTRWQQVKETLASAMEQETTAERALFLTQACAGDTALRHEVESLLGQSGGALDSWADGGGFIGTESSTAPNEGRRIGAYRLVRELGRGGMGAVWLATRADQEFQQTAAIKLLKRGTDTDEVLRRFRAEREILARLQHPNIARLLDGGTTDDGLPYFVMEYVEGTRLTDFVAQQKLSLGERLQLFRKICAAVQFAHQNLIVHRDLKPANILVTADGEPKLLDFGIAKLLAPGADAWEATIAGRERLTPAYASPEQVLGGPVTTVSDVYALGALLYETLCERPPHSFSGERPSPTELVRVICQSEPALPRTVAASPEMRRSLRGDLETIIRRAMSQEPTRRYSGAGELADDLRRYQEGWPVHARRDTVGYRAGKFVGRNKLGVATGAAIVLLVVGSAVMTAWQARKIDQQRVRADERFNQVRKLAHAVLFDYHDQIALLPGSTHVRELLVKDALDYLDLLSRDAAADHSLRRELATAYEKVGEIQGNAYYDNLGNTAGAMQSYRKSLSIRQALYSANPENPDGSFELGRSHEGVGDMLYAMEDLPGCLASYRTAAPFFAKPPTSSANNLRQRLALAELYVKIGDTQGMDGYANLGDTAAALVSYKEAEALLDPLFTADPHDQTIKARLVEVLSHLGTLADSAGDILAALTAGRRSVELAQEIAAADPTNYAHRLPVLTARAFLRYALRDNNQSAEAIEHSKATIGELQAMRAADPKNNLLQRNLAVTYNALGLDLLATEDAKGAEENHRVALSIFEEMQAASPASEEYKTDLAFTEARLGEAEAATGDYASALECYHRSIRHRGGKEVTASTNAHARQNLSLLEADLGKALAATGQSEAAAAEFARGISLAEELSTASPSNAKLRADLALRYAEFAAFHLQVAETSRATRKAPAPDEQIAREYFTRSQAVWQELRAKGTLLPIHEHKPEELQRPLKRCDALLQQAVP